MVGELGCGGIEGDRGSEGWMGGGVEGQWWSRQHVGLRVVMEGLTLLKTCPRGAHCGFKCLGNS